MHKKIIGILVFILLIATTFSPVAGTIDEKTITSTGRIESVPVLDFINITGGLLSISVVLMNFGEGTAHDIIWSMNVSGGLYDNPFIINIFLLFGVDLDDLKIEGEIDSLEPGEERIISIGPMLGLGRFTVYFNCKYIIRNLSRCDVDVEVKQEWIDYGLLFLHSFPQNIQPEKEWMTIEDYEYLPNGKEVAFTFSGPPIGITKMHNVRVYNSSSIDIEFLASCKFNNGTGVLKECHFTENLVKSTDASWEVELVNGE